MRNLLEYPVTTREIMQALEQAAKDLGADGGVGDITPVALDILRGYLDSNPWVVQDACLAAHREMIRAVYGADCIPRHEEPD